MKEAKGPFFNLLMNRDHKVASSDRSGDVGLWISKTLKAEPR